MPYTIKKAIAASRWDLIVNGITIHSAGTKKEINEIVGELCIKQLLTVELTS